MLQHGTILSAEPMATNNVWFHIMQRTSKFRNFAKRVSICRIGFAETTKSAFHPGIRNLKNIRRKPQTKTFQIPRVNSVFSVRLRSRRRRSSPMLRRTVPCFRIPEIWSSHDEMVFGVDRRSLEFRPQSFRHGWGQLSPHPLNFGWNRCQLYGFPGNRGIGGKLSLTESEAYRSYARRSWGRWLVASVSNKKYHLHKIHRLLCLCLIAVPCLTSWLPKDCD